MSDAPEIAEALGVAVGLAVVRYRQYRDLVDQGEPVSTEFMVQAREQVIAARRRLRQAGVENTAMLNDLDYALAPTQAPPTGTA